MPNSGYSPNKKEVANDKLFNTKMWQEAKIKHIHPGMYQVLLLNDDATPMDFVVFLLEQIFHMSSEEAYGVMIRIHTTGQAVCGLFTREVAETKVMQVIDFARANEYPLKCIMHKSDEHVIKKS